MSEKQNTPLPLAELADAAFSAAAEQVLRRARQSGTDIVIWRNGRIVKLSPDDIEREWVEARGSVGLTTSATKS